jgi:hypothetical protein
MFPAAQALAFDSLRSHHLDAVGDVFHILENLTPFAAFLPWTSVAHRMKPLAVLSMAWGLVMMALFAVRLTSAHIPDIPNLQTHWANAVADGEAIAILSLVIALLFLLFREQQQTARERAVLAGEMQAAQQVQCMLAPSVLDAVPGMRIDVAFHPIREVGDDFYSCRILPGNRQRILLGDVSGKGAAAAMTAAVLIGAAQRRDHESPAALLTPLNHVFADMCLEGFATPAASIFIGIHRREHWRARPSLGQLPNLGAKPLSFTTRGLQRRDRRASPGAPESSMREATLPQARPRPRSPSEDRWLPPRTATRQ